MKLAIVRLAAALSLTAGICLRAQQGDPASPGTSSASAETQSARCDAICAVEPRSPNPSSPLAWEQELTLTDEQRTRVRAIEDKALADAKDLLTAEQQEKLKELAKPESMMQCMRAMKHAGPTAGEIGCSQAHGQAEGPHTSHQNHE